MLAILTALLLFWTETAFADDPSEAERYYQEGQLAYDRGDFDVAVAAWQRSYQLSNAPDLIYNVAQAHRLADHCTLALQSYRRFVELDPASPKRALAEGFIRELTPVCGSPPVATPIATPTVTPIAAPIERPPHTKKIVGLVVASSGVGLIATGFYFGHRAASLSDEVARACYNGCDWTTYSGKDSAGRRDQTLQFVFKGAGIAAVIGGGALYWFGRSNATSSVAVAPRSGGAVLTWSGSW